MEIMEKITHVCTYLDQDKTQMSYNALRPLKNIYNYVKSNGPWR